MNISPFFLPASDEGGFQSDLAIVVNASGARRSGATPLSFPSDGVERRVSSEPTTVAATGRASLASPNPAVLARRSSPSWMTTVIASPSIKHELLEMARPAFANPSDDGAIVVRSSIERRRRATPLSFPSDGVERRVSSEPTTAIATAPQSLSGRNAVVLSRRSSPSWFTAVTASFSINHELIETARPPFANRSDDGAIVVNASGARRSGATPLSFPSDGVERRVSSEPTTAVATGRASLASRNPAVLSRRSSPSWMTTVIASPSIKHELLEMARPAFANPSDDGAIVVRSSIERRRRATPLSFPSDGVERRVSSEPTTAIATAPQSLSGRNAVVLSRRSSPSWFTAVTASFSINHELIEIARPPFANRSDDGAIVVNASGARRSGATPLSFPSDGVERRVSSEPTTVAATGRASLASPNPAVLARRSSPSWMTTVIASPSIKHELLEMARPAFANPSDDGAIVVRSSIERRRRATHQQGTYADRTLEHGLNADGTFDEGDRRNDGVERRRSFFIVTA